MAKLKKILFVVLFFINAFFYVFRSGADRIGGDEVASYSALMPFLHGLLQGKIIPTFLVYYHEPIQQLIQLPVILLGASAFFVRLPNIVCGILTYFILYKIGRQLFGNKSWYVLCILAIYTFSGFTVVLRMGIDAALFNLILALSVKYLIDFYKNRKNHDFQKALLLMTTNLFVFIDGIFLFGFLFFGRFKTIKERIGLALKIWKPMVLAFLMIFLWTASVYVGSIWSNLYDWRLQSPFRLITRGFSYSLDSSLNNISLFRQFNSIEFTILIFGLLMFSIFDKRSKIIWALLAIPFIYFNLVKMPTLHILNFWILIILTAVLGLRFLCEKKNWLKFILVPLVVLSLFRNIQQVSLRNPFIADTNYKTAATYLRQHTAPCEKVFTNLDGYTFRFYFNRGYVTKLSNEINYAVIGNSDSFDSEEFGKLGIIDREGKSYISIYKRRYSGEVLKLNFIDNNLFSFQNTLTYVNNCRFFFLKFLSFWF